MMYYWVCLQTKILKQAKGSTEVRLEDDIGSSCRIAINIFHKTVFADPFGMFFLFSIKTFSFGLLKNWLGLASNTSTVLVADTAGSQIRPLGMWVGGWRENQKHNTGIAILGEISRALPYSWTHTNKRNKLEMCNFCSLLCVVI